MDDEGFFCCVVFVVGLVAGAGIALATHDPCVSREVLVSKGHAEYVIVDPATGRTEFRLKEVK